MLSDETKSRECFIHGFSAVKKPQFAFSDFPRKKSVKIFDFFKKIFENLLHFFDFCGIICVVVCNLA